MSDYSKMSDEDLVGSIAYYQRRLGAGLKPDEDTSPEREKKYLDQKRDLEEMLREASVRGISESKIHNEWIKYEEREKRVKKDIRFHETISTLLIERPDDIFESEKNRLMKDPILRNNVVSIARDKLKEKIRNYELQKRRGEHRELNICGFEITPSDESYFMRFNINQDNEWMHLPFFINKYGLLGVKTQEEFNKLIVQISNAFHSIKQQDLGEYQEIQRNLFWVDGSNIAKEYLNGLVFLAEKKLRKEKYVINIANLLDFSKIELIAKSFSSPVFMYWFYEGKLPAYSWSAQNGEPMMRALVSGDYRKCYNAEKRLIKRAVRDIGERYE